MATRQGYLWKRAGNGPPSMQKVFCVLAGTTLWDFDTEEEAGLGLRPRCEIDIIGVSPWDGKIRFQSYAFGFLFLSSQGTTFYAVAQSKEDLEFWLSAMRIGLDAKFGISLPREEPLGPTKPPTRRDADTCAISGQHLNRSTKCFCLSCGGAFGMEYCCEDVPLLHYGMQQGARVCRNCFLAQYFLNHLKLLNATLRTHLHELDLEGRDILDKNSAKIVVFRQQTQEALLAWQLYEANKITAHEFSELLKADARAKDERDVTALEEFQQDLAVADDAITLLRYLHDYRDEGFPLRYALILQKLLELADANVAAVDFILPQLMHIFVLMSDRGLNQVLQLEALEEFIVQVCTRSSVHIALRIVWSMMGYYEDTLQLAAPVALLSKRARIIRLTLHVEAAVRGSVTELNPEILHIFTIPSAAQLDLIRREWTLVHNCRCHHLLRPFPPMTALAKRLALASSEAGGKQPLTSLPPVTAPVQPPPPPTATTTSPPDAGGKPHPPMPPPPSRHNSDAFSFAIEMKFVKELTDVAESLRHVDIPLRRETLRASLQRIQKDYKDVYFPITRDYGAMPRIVRVCVDEGAVFRSKARVPVLMCFEVMRPVVVGGLKESSRSSYARRRRTSSMDYVSEEEVEHLMDKGAFHRRMNSLETSQDKSPRPVAPTLQTLSSSKSGGSSTELSETIDLTLTQNPSSPRNGGSLSPRSTPRSLGHSSSQGGGGSSGNLVTEYANKAEIFKMVMSRRKKTSGTYGVGGHHRREENSSSMGGGNGNGLLGEGEVKEGEVNLANLIKQYEECCTLDESESGMSRGISPAVQTAIEEFKKGNLSEADVGKIVAKDREFRRNIQENSYLDVQFFVSMAFGESWANKKARVKAASADGSKEGWDLMSMIVKSNDDLRQEVCTVQLIELCRDIFEDAGLELWLEPYGIISTTSSTGLIETLTDALSLDALKKKEGYVSLARHFEVSYGHDKSQLAHAKRCFISSLAAYSLVCYLLQIKDRHNGNILLDTEGHIVHIDYGFILGIAPGGSFSIETAPFKLTAEMVEVMGGTDSPLFDEFITLFVCGFFALQVNIERIVTLIEILAEQSRFPCFAANDKHTIIQRLRARLLPGRQPPTRLETLGHALDLVHRSYTSITTAQYDNYQFFTQDIMP